MRNYFNIGVNAHLNIVTSLCLVLGLYVHPTDKLYAEAQDKSNHSVKFGVYAEPDPTNAHKEHPTVFNLSPRSDGTVGYGALHNRPNGGFDLVEVGTFEVLRYPKMENRGRGSFSGTNIHSWPVGHDWVVETMAMKSWIEKYRDENGIKRNTPFRFIEVVLSSSVAGVGNEVTIFATDYDHNGKKKIEINPKWILLDIENALKLFNHIEAGTSVAITIERSHSPS